MESTGYIIRTYRTSDFDSLVRLKNEAALLSSNGSYMSPDAIREGFSRPGYSTEQCLFVVERYGAVVGYMELFPEVKIGRVILDGLIEQPHRCIGLAKRLLQETMKRARNMGANAAHVNVREGNSHARAALENTGFYVIRRHLEIEIDLKNLSEPDKVSLPIRPLGENELERLTVIQNRSFTGSWGFSPNTIEEIAHAAGTGNDGVEGVCLAVDGEKTAGYCWARTQEDGRGNSWGRIGMLGVDPDYQGRGLGRELLLKGLSFLRGKGHDTAQLTVDSENTVAYNLYQSVGFTLRDISLWYEKHVG
ncbi:MAG TPA: GNAT family N-acetyltransferase [Dehalococcoidia bacterium]|nr:GNAT family N-acetyltransferase [Dehalococcoidia bacterium]